VIRFVSHKGTSSQAILFKLQTVYGMNAPTLRSIQNGTADFANGRTELADLAGPGRPREPGNVGAVRDLIKSEGFLSQKQIGPMLGFHYDTTGTKKACSRSGIPGLIWCDDVLSRAKCQSRFLRGQSSTQDYRRQGARSSNIDSTWNLAPS
jgi:hypothetical protein